MFVEELKVGYHLSTAEKLYVDWVVGEIRRNKYLGKIEVVGSRAEGHRLSTGHFYSEFEASEKWLDQLDAIARKRNLSAGNLREIVNYLPRRTPKEVFRFLSLNRGHLDADLDLLIEERKPGIEQKYEDIMPPRGSGLVVDVFQDGDVIRECVYNY